MDFKNITFFNAVKSRINWLGQRQEVLAQNIANADTPKYRSRDLKPFQFKEIVRSQARLVNMNVSNPKHLGGARKRIRDFSVEVDRKPYETSPDGNSVILEEQMSKISETGINYNLAMNLYKKQLTMIKMSIGNGR